MKINNNYFILIFYLISEQVIIEQVIKNLHQKYLKFHIKKFL